MTVDYRGKSVVVDASKDDGEIIVYSHPGDSIKLDFDISSLKKEVIGGDLVIHLLNGSNLTIVNFGLMAIDGVAPKIQDTTGQNYDPYSLFDAQAYTVDDINGKQVLSRAIYSPDSLNPPGDSLPSAKEIADGKSDQAKQMGELYTPEQNVTPEFGPMYLAYLLKTLLHKSDYTNYSSVQYTSKDSFPNTQVNNQDYPQKSLVIAPKFTPAYGAAFKDEAGTGPSKGYSHLFVKSGGGLRMEDDSAKLMYQREKIDLSSRPTAQYFNEFTDPSHGYIYRKFNISVPTDSITFKDITIKNLPEGVEVYADSDDKSFVVKSTGGGSYFIEIKGSGQGFVNLQLRYKEGFVDSSITSKIAISYNGSSSINDAVVSGEKNIFLNFAPVKSNDDILNGGGNVFTYSTLNDKLEIIFTSDNDYVAAGDRDIIYDTKSGDDQVYGGTAAVDKFNLGSGNDAFYSYIGSDTVDGQEGSDVLFMARTYKNGVSAKLTAEGKGLSLQGSHDGVGFLSTFVNFTDIYFEGTQKGRTDIDVSNDTIYLKSTQEYSQDIKVHFGGGNNKVVANTKIIIENQSEGYDVRSYDDAYHGLLVADNPSGTLQIDGSSDGALIKSNSGVSLSGLNFNGVAGASNIADYSKRVSSIAFHASSWELTTESVTNILVNISEVKGSTVATNMFYGDKDSSIYYVGGSNPASTTLTYEDLTSYAGGSDGVIIDFVNKTVNKGGSTDSFSNVGSIKGSNYNDTFKLAANRGYEINGVAGINTADYSADTGFNSIHIDVNFSRGEVQRSNAVYDRIQSISHVIATDSGDTFEIASDKRSYLLDGGGGVDSLRYASSASYKVALTFTGNTANNIHVEIVKGTFGIGDTVDRVELYRLTSNTENTVVFKNIGQLDLVNISNPTATGNVTTDSVITVEGVDSAYTINYDTYFMNRFNKFGYLHFNETSSSGQVNLILKTRIGADSFLKIEASSSTSNANTLSLYGLTSGESAVKSTDKFDLNTNTISIRGASEVSAGTSFKGFNHFIGTSFSDHLKFSDDGHLSSLDGLNSISLKEYLFDGVHDSGSILDFSGINAVYAPAATGKGLRIVIPELNMGLLGSVLSRNEVTIDRVLVMSFENISHFIGTNNNDVFVLPVSGLSSISIDGGRGTDLVSYAEFTTGQVISGSEIGRFESIEGIEGSAFKDLFNLTDSNPVGVPVFSISGGGDLDTIKYLAGSGYAPTINIDITALKTTVTKAAGISDDITNIGVIDLSGISRSTGQSIAINDGGSNVTTTAGEGYTSGGNNTVLYIANSMANFENTNIAFVGTTRAVTVNLRKATGTSKAGSWIDVQKGTAAHTITTYFSNIQNINLGSNGQADTVYFYSSIKDLSWVHDSSAPFLTLKLSTDENHDVFSLLKYVSNSSSVMTLDVNKDFIDPDYSKLHIQKTGFKIFEGAKNISYNISFVSQASNSYTFKAGNQSSKDTIVYNDPTHTYGADLTVNVSSISDGSVIQMSIDKGSGATTDTTNDIYHYQGTAGKDTINFTGGEVVKHSMYFDGQSSISLNDKVHYNIDTSVIFTVASQTSAKAVRGSGQYTDEYMGGFTTFEGGTTTDRFNIEGAESGYSSNMNYYGGANSIGTTVLDSISFANITSDLSINFIYEGVSAAYKSYFDVNALHTHIRGIAEIYGSRINKNTYDLNGFFSNIVATTYTDGSNTSIKNLVLHGGSIATDQITLNDRSSGVGYSVDILSGVITDKSVKSLGKSITIRDSIETVILGGADDTIIVPQAGSIGLSGVTNVNAGGGSNTVSFDSWNIPNSNIDILSPSSSSSYSLMNISQVQGTKYDDTFVFDSSTSSSTNINNTTTLDGNAGTDTLDFSNLTGVAKLEVSLQSAGGGVLSSVSKYATLASAAVNNNISNIERFKLGASNSTVNFLFHNNAGSYIIDASATGGVGAQSCVMNYSNVASSASYRFDLGYNTVIKESGNRDVYSQWVTKIIGTQGNDEFTLGKSTIYTTQSSIMIDGGLGTNTLNGSALKSGLTYNLSSASHTITLADGFAFTTTNFQSIIGTSEDDTFTLAEHTNDYSFDGGSGHTTYDEINLNAYSTLISKTSLAINLSAGNIIMSANGTSYQNNISGINKFVANSVGTELHVENVGSFTSYDFEGDTTQDNNYVSYAKASSGVIIQAILSQTMQVSKVGAAVDTLKGIRTIKTYQNNDQVIIDNKFTSLIATTQTVNFTDDSNDDIDSINFKSTSPINSGQYEVNFSTNTLKYNGTTVNAHFDKFEKVMFNNLSVGASLSSLTEKVVSNTLYNVDYSNSTLSTFELENNSSSLHINIGSSTRLSNKSDINIQNLITSSNHSLTGVDSLILNGTVVGNYELNYDGAKVNSGGTSPFSIAASSGSYNISATFTNLDYNSTDTTQEYTFENVIANQAIGLQVNYTNAGGSSDINPILPTGNLLNLTIHETRARNITVVNHKLTTPGAYARHYDISTGGTLHFNTNSSAVTLDSKQVSSTDSVDQFFATLSSSANNVSLNIKAGSTSNTMIHITERAGYLKYINSDAPTSSAWHSTISLRNMVGTSLKQSITINKAGIGTVNINNDGTSKGIINTSNIYDFEGSTTGLNEFIYSGTDFSSLARPLAFNGASTASNSLIFSLSNESLIVDMVNKVVQNNIFYTSETQATFENINNIAFNEAIGSSIRVIDVGTTLQNLDLKGNLTSGGTTINMAGAFSGKNIQVDITSASATGGMSGDVSFLGGGFSFTGVGTIPSYHHLSSFVLADSDDTVTYSDNNFFTDFVNVIAASKQVVIEGGLGNNAFSSLGSNTISANESMQIKWIDTASFIGSGPTDSYNDSYAFKPEAATTYTAILVNFSDVRLNISSIAANKKIVASINQLGTTAPDSNHYLSAGNLAGISGLSVPNAGVTSQALWNSSAYYPIEMDINTSITGISSISLNMLEDYNNSFSIKAVNGTDFTAHTYRASGFDSFKIGGGSYNANIYINKLKGTQAFAIDATNAGHQSVFDFSNVSDGSTYVFIASQFSIGGTNNMAFIIEDRSQAVRYGDFIGASDTLTLTQGDDIVQITNDMSSTTVVKPSSIDGSGGNNILEIAYDITTSANFVDLTQANYIELQAQHYVNFATVKIGAFVNVGIKYNPDMSSYGNLPSVKLELSDPTSHASITDPVNSSTGIDTLLTANSWIVGLYGSFSGRELEISGPGSAEIHLSNRSGFQIYEANTLNFDSYVGSASLKAYKVFNIDYSGNSLQMNQLPMYSDVAGVVTNYRVYTGALSDSDKEAEWVYFVENKIGEDGSHEHPYTNDRTIVFHFTNKKVSINTGPSFSDMDNSITWEPGDNNGDVPTNTFRTYNASSLYYSPDNSTNNHNGKSSQSVSNTNYNTNYNTNNYSLDNNTHDNVWHDQQDYTKYINQHTSIGNTDNYWDSFSHNLESANINSTNYTEQNKANLEDAKSQKAVENHYSQHASHSSVSNYYKVASATDKTHDSKPANNNSNHSHHDVVKHDTKGDPKPHNVSDTKTSSDHYSSDHYSSDHYNHKTDSSHLDLNQAFHLAKAKFNHEDAISSSHHNALWEGELSDLLEVAYYHDEVNSMSYTLEGSNLYTESSTGSYEDHSTVSKHKLHHSDN